MPIVCVPGPALRESEKELSTVIYERVGDEKSFARIRSKGDHALFGGVTTLQMKDRLGVPESRPLAGFLPTVTIKARDFANELTVPASWLARRTAQGVATSWVVCSHELVRY
ncbi:MAG: hypothetical protein IT456_04070 [Planctomycetes bacterium]|nr:hypothetical protein [Planctomycetota bacterium]